MSDLETARHLSSISREAASRAYEADAGTSGKIAVWLITVLTTLHAGGLVAALQNAEKLANPHQTQCALLIGLLSTLVAGAASLVHYNMLAEKWRIAMHLEVEGASEITEAYDKWDTAATRANWLACAAAGIALTALAASGAFAIGD